MILHSVCFVPSGPLSWGSARMRAYWPAKNMPGAVVAKDSDPLPDAEVYIWQKHFNIDRIRETRHKRHYWDICDPMWWFSPKEVAALLPYLAGVVFSSYGLMMDFKENYGSAIPLYTIDDRFDMAHFSMRRQHTDVTPVRLIWYGVAVNRMSLLGALTNLERLTASGYEIELTIMDDRPDQQLGRFPFPLYHVKWELDKENAVIASHDIALLPPYPGPWGAVKSDNKMHTAAVCGLPSTSGHNYDELRLLIQDSDMRQRMADAYPLDLFDVYRSALEWEAILWPS